MTKKKKKKGRGGREGKKIKEIETFCLCFVTCGGLFKISEER